MDAIKHISEFNISQYCVLQIYCKTEIPLQWNFHFFRTHITSKTIQLHSSKTIINSTSWSRKYIRSIQSRLYNVIFRGSHPEVFLGKVVLKICSKFKGEHFSRSVFLIKLQTYLNRTSTWVFCCKFAGYF